MREMREWRAWKSAFHTLRHQQLDQEQCGRGRERTRSLQESQEVLRGGKRGLGFCWCFCDEAVRRRWDIEKDVPLEPKGKGMESKSKQSGVTTEKMLPNVDICWNVLLMSMSHLNMTTVSSWHPRRASAVWSAWTWLHRFCLVLLLSARAWAFIPRSSRDSHPPPLFQGLSWGWEMVVCRPGGLQASRLEMKHEMKHTLPQPLHWKLKDSFRAWIQADLRTLDEKGEGEEGLSFDFIFLSLLEINLTKNKG